MFSRQFTASFPYYVYVQDGRQYFLQLTKHLYVGWLEYLSFRVPAGGTELKHFLLSMADHNFDLSSN
jgi:hypothetical protein